jgi:hypothetical protein
MRRIKSNYEFRHSQVFTPPDVVRLFWTIVQKHRRELGKVLDLGAGDGRFARGGKFERYLGIEIDPETSRQGLPEKAAIEYGCAFKFAGPGWDAVIGNPPYLRHHYIELSWTKRITRRFRNSLGVELSGQSNLFVYFLLLGLELAKKDGIVAMLTPYEWVSRPSTKSLRELIDRNSWSVSTYRFKDRVFEGVMTTAAICVIDKADVSGGWKFFEVGRDGKIAGKRQASGSRHAVLPYTNRGKWWALRGLSPGTQKVFTLTEGDRIHHGLALTDVWPCVTSLTALDEGVRDLDEQTFRKYYRDRGEKCWLIRSSESKLSPALIRYLEGVPAAARDTSTCNDRDTWYRFRPFHVAQILIASGFVRRGPKVVRNLIGAHHVGSVYGVFGPHSGCAPVANRLRKFDFEGRVVKHSGHLKKIEVRQLNSVLNDA